MGTSAHTDSSNQSTESIDAALAAIRARKEAKARGASPSSVPRPPSERSTSSESKVAKLTNEEKAAERAARDAARAVERAHRNVARDAKKLAKLEAKPTAHLRKVNKAAERLGSLGDHAQTLFNDATTNLSAAELATLANHLLHFNREKATLRALNQMVSIGQVVTIVGGDPRFIGRDGVVTRAQRIRCYVHIEGVSKDLYLYTSDVETRVEEAKVDIAV